MQIQLINEYSYRTNKKVVMKNPNLNSILDKVIKDNDFEGFFEDVNYKVNVIKLTYHMKRFYISNKDNDMIAICFDYDYKYNRIIARENYNEYLFARLYGWCLRNNISIKEITHKLDEKVKYSIMCNLSYFISYDKYTEDDVKRIIFKFTKELIKNVDDIDVLSGRYFSLVNKPTELYFVRLGEKDEDKIKIEIKDMKKEDLITFFFDLLYFS